MSSQSGSVLEKTHNAKQINRHNEINGSNCQVSPNYIPADLKKFRAVNLKQKKNSILITSCNS